MARLKIRIVAQNDAGDAAAGATVKLYQPGTAAVAGSATTGTPFAGNLYAGVAGGSPVSTSRTADSTGQVVVYTDTASRCDVGVETSEGASVFPYEEFQYDPADLATAATVAADLADYATLTGAETLANKSLAAPVVTGQATFPDGTAAAPSVMFGSTPGFYRAGAGLLGLPAGGAASFVWDSAATPGGPRSYISEAALTKAALTLTRGGSTSSGIDPDDTYTGLLMATSFQKEGGEAIKGSVYGVQPQATEGFMAGGSFVAEATSAGSWTPPGGGALHGFIGVLAASQGYQDGTRIWGGNILARQLANDASSVCGLEIDIESRSGATVQDRYGIQIVTASLGTSGGTNEDIAIKIANKNGTEANRWKVGIGFHSPDGAAGSDGWPIRSTGDLIKAYGTSISAAAGIDFSAVSFSGNSLDMPKFKVKGNGRVSINTNTQTTEAPLYIDATGEAYALRIDGFTVQPSAGSSAGYLELRRGSTTYKIQLYANA